MVDDFLGLFFTASWQFFWEMVEPLHSKEFTQIHCIPIYKKYEILNAMLKITLTLVSIYFLFEVNHEEHLAHYLSKKQSND